jgi:hypothetical protein
MAVQEQKPVPAGPRPVLQIETRDSFDGDIQQRLVFRRRFALGIRPIGKQGKVEIAVRAGEVMHLELSDKLFDLRRRRQQHRHDDHGAQILGYAFGELHSGKDGGAEAVGDEAVDKGDCGIRCGDQREQAKTTKRPAGNPQSRQEIYRERAIRIVATAIALR